MSEYFQHSNAIDKHNHVRQFLLQLEKHWITEDGYFHIMMTLFGMGITDCWKGYKFHLGNRHRHKNVSIDAFVDLLCHDLINNQFSGVTDDEATLVIPGTPPDCMVPVDSHYVATAPPAALTIQVLPCDYTAVSSLTLSNDLLSSRLEILSHELTKMQENERRTDPTANSYERTKRRRCKAKACGKNDL